MRLKLISRLKKSLEAGGSEVREVKGLYILTQRLDWGSTILRPSPLLIA